MSNNLMDIPKGKVSCLLCRGFISYKSSDKTRFEDHMLNEHDVKFDSDVILSVGVMTQKEKAFIVKSSLQRLNEISNNQIPRSGETLLRAASNPIQRSSNPPPPRHAANNSGRMPQQMQRMHRPQTASVVGTRQIRPQAPVPSAPVRRLQNTNVSITTVDQSVKCGQCSQTLENSSALTEHMKSIHLSRFAGLQISTENKNKRLSLPSPVWDSTNVKQELRLNSTLPQKDQIPSKKARIIDATPANLKRLSTSNIPSNIYYGFGSNNSPLQNNISKMIPQAQIPKSISYQGSPSSRPVLGSHAKYSSPRQLLQSSQTVIPPPVGATTAETKSDPAIKCNTCGKFVKQSIFKIHKQEHMKNGEEDIAANTKKTEIKKSKREEKLIDFVDITDSDEETPSKSERTKPSAKNIACPSCDKKLASNMALKMHMNLKHPVKSETVDTEELLVEESDGVSKDDTNDKIRNEVENMETMELLDNLVNFLNDT